jgi:hypothetical protein
MISSAEYFIAHNRLDVSDHEILMRLAQEASRLACAALERCNEGSLAKDRKDERALAAAIGYVQAAAEIAAERISLGADQIATSRNKLSKAWALEIDPNWRCASDDQD